MSMTKAEIIAQVLNIAACLRPPVDATFDDSAGYTEQEIAATLEVSLKNVSAAESVRTCVDFGHLDVACCDTYHHFDPHFEMALINIESGGNAWICCALDRELNPRKQSEGERSPEWKATSKMFDGDLVDLELFLRNGLSD